MNSQSLLAALPILFVFMACNQTKPVESKSEKTVELSVFIDPLCNEHTKEFPAPELIAQYGKHTAYNITTEKSGEFTSVSFDFISDCCRSFSGNARVVNDTLLLQYFGTGSTVCECFCDYRSTFTFKADVKPWKHVTALYITAR